MCVTDRHDMTLAFKVALNPNTTKQPTSIAEMIWIVYQRLENVVGKGKKNAGYQHFLLYPTMFTESLFSRKVQNMECKGKCWVEILCSK